MALPSTLRRFEVELADVDRGVYETLDLRVAQHPSEESVRLVVRVLARGLLHEEGLEFGKGLSTTEEPALWVKSLESGKGGPNALLWVDVGAPAAERLHRASKHAERVAVVTDRDDAQLKRLWRGQKIHDKDRIEVIRLPLELVTALAERIERQVHWVVSINDGHMHVTTGNETFEGEVTRTTVDALCQAE